MLASRGWILAGALTLVLAGSAWLGTHSAAFRLHSLVVVGEHRLSEAQVRRLGGLTPETNVFWLSPGAVVARLEQSPWIASAEVSRRLPSTLLITIQERAPVAVLPGPREQVVGADGVVLGGATRAAAAGLPVVHVGGGVGPQAEPDASALRLALGAVAALPAQLRREVATVTAQAGPTQNVVLRMRDGTEVRFGDDSQARDKGRVLGALMRWATKHGVHPAVIDVESPVSPSISRT